MQNGIIMKRILSLSLIGLFVGLSQSLSAQQIPLYSNYFFTPYIYNPAQSGTSGSTELSAMYRRQWEGVQGAPQTAAIALNGNIGSDNVGYSVYGFNDEAGILQTYGFYGAYAYHVQLSENNFLSFGLAGGFMNSGLNQAAINASSTGDPILSGDFSGRGLFDINTGINLRLGNFQIGAAVPQLLGSPVRFVNQPDLEASYQTFRHYMFNIQYDFEIVPDRTTLSPMVMVRAAENVPVMVDAGAMLDLKNLFFVGAMYRSNYAVTGNLGFHINDQLTVGYAYDFSTNQYSANLGSTQEIMLTWRFGSNSSVERLENEVKRMRQMDRRRKDDMEQTIEDKMEEIKDELRREYEEAKRKIEEEGQSFEDAAEESNRERDRREQQQQQQRERDRAEKAASSDSQMDDAGASKVQAGSKGYYVTAGVFGSEANANRKAKSLKDKGLDAGVFLDSSNNMYYVFLFKFDTYQQAQQVRQSKAGGRYDGGLWIKVID